jgi:hypothetical protein
MFILKRNESRVVDIPSRTGAKRLGILMISIAAPPAADGLSLRTGIYLVPWWEVFRWERPWFIEPKAKKEAPKEPAVFRISDDMLTTISADHNPREDLIPKWIRIVPEEGE